MTDPESSNKKWHESLADIVAVVAFTAIVTSPCWGAVLYAWVTRR